MVQDSKQPDKKKKRALPSPIQFLEKIQKKLAPEGKPVLAGIWSNEQAFLSAIKSLKEKGYKQFSAITPCPVHGLEELLEIKRSWIPYITFIFGSAGCLFGLWFTWWTSAVNWPLIVGGKPLWSLPAFIPIIFECTILLGALSSVGALFYACRIPSVDPPVLDPDLTSHKFAIYFSIKGQKISHNEQAAIEDLEQHLKSFGAQKVLHTSF